MISLGWKLIRQNFKNYYNLSYDSSGFALEGFAEIVDIGDDAGAAFFGEGDGGFDFREHRAGLEITVFDEFVDFFYGGLVDWLFVGKSEIDTGVRNGGD